MTKYIIVTAMVKLPCEATDEQIKEWVNFCFHNGAIRIDNPLSNFDMDSDGYSNYTRSAMTETFDTMACSWSEDGEDGPYATSCGGYFSINDGTPADNGMKFCCYCGKPLEHVLYEENQDA